MSGKYRINYRNDKLREMSNYKKATKFDLILYKIKSQKMKARPFPMNYAMMGILTGSYFSYQSRHNISKEKDIPVVIMATVFWPLTIITLLTKRN